MMRTYQLPVVIFDTIDPKWRGDLFRFIDSGDGSVEFLEFLDGNVECQRVVETAFTLVSQDIAATARQLKADNAEARPDSGDSMNTTFARLLAHMLLTLVNLNDENRAEIVRDVESWIPPQHQQEARAIINEIGRHDAWLFMEDHQVS